MNELVTTELVTAARCGDVICIKRMLDAGEDPNLYEQWPYTDSEHSALEQAAIALQPDCLGLLAPYCDETTLHITLRRVLQQSQTAPSATASDKNTQMVEILAKHAPEAALGIAAKMKEYDLVRHLLEAGYKPETSIRKRSDFWRPTRVPGAPYPYSALVAACENGDYAMAKLLVSHGADVDPNFGNHFNERHRLLTFPLTQAAATGETRLVSLLLRAGARVNPKDGEGVLRSPGSPLQFAAFRNHLEIAQMLISEGAKLDSCHGYYLGPLHAAVYSSRTAMVKLLLQSGAKPDMMIERVRNCSHPGYTLCGTPIQAAIINGYDDIVQLLLAYGADPNTGFRKDGSHDDTWPRCLTEIQKKRRDMVTHNWVEIGMTCDDTE